MVCSAGARRLVADGLSPNFPHLDADAVANWFLRRWPDVRASDALEVPATQFACQGLELDHVGLCWGNDLIRRGGRTEWVARSFAGTRWQEPRGEAAIAYQINTYRVLLTRARYETVIWVPAGRFARRDAFPRGVRRNCPVPDGMWRAGCAGRTDGGTRGSGADVVGL